MLPNDHSLLTSLPKSLFRKQLIRETVVKKTDKDKLMQSFFKSLILPMMLNSEHLLSSGTENIPASYLAINSVV